MELIDVMKIYGLAGIVIALQWLAIAKMYSDQRKKDERSEAKFENIIMHITETQKEMIPVLNAILSVQQKRGK